jgi:hypothetical protein
MKSRNLMGILLIAILTSLAMSTGAWAKKGGKPGGDGSGTARVQILVEGAIEGVVECEESLSANSSVVLCNQNQKFDLTSAIVNALYPTGCFAEGERPGTVQLYVNKDNSAEAWFRFHAPDTTEMDILYRLEVYAGSWSGNFPPDAGESISMTSNAWKLVTSNKRQSRDACLGDGNDPINDPIKVTLSVLCPTSGSCP